MEAGLVLALMIVFGVLSIVARKRDYDGLRHKIMTTRRVRVPVSSPRPDGQTHQEEVKQ